MTSMQLPINLILHNVTVIKCLKELKDCLSITTSIAKSVLIAFELMVALTLVVLTSLVKTMSINIYTLWPALWPAIRRLT